MILDAHGLRIELPASWSGRLYGRAGGVATLHAASFPLTLEDGEFGDRTTSRMPHEGSFLALNEYRRGGGLEPGQGLFEAPRIPRRLDPSSFSSNGLAHPRSGQVGMQHFFTSGRRPFCLYVVLAGNRMVRRRHLAVVDRVLETLQIRARD